MADPDFALMMKILVNLQGEVAKVRGDLEIINSRLADHSQLLNEVKLDIASIQERLG